MTAPSDLIAEAPEASHTPWTAQPSGDGDGLWIVLDDCGNLVFFGMDNATARMFAAAPDLLAALRETLGIARRNEDGGFVRRAEAAIAKAEGRVLPSPGGER